jgi:hypothetical protein
VLATGIEPLLRTGLVDLFKKKLVFMNAGNTKATNFFLIEEWTNFAFRLGDCKPMCGGGQCAGLYSCFSPELQLKTCYEKHVLKKDMQ